MVTIRIKNKRVKVFNLLLVIIILVLLIYVFLKLIFLLPIFKTTYNYKTDYGFYKTDSKFIFKSKIITCNVTEIKKVEVKENDIKSFLSKDLISDGYKTKDNNTYIRKSKYYGFCTKQKKAYKKEYNNSYYKLKLNGDGIQEINVFDKYNDEYVDFYINNKKTKDIDILSNINTEKVGNYVIGYTLNISKLHHERLYRIVRVVDLEKPVITLAGDDNITLEYNKEYVEPGYTATDNYDGDITANVKIDGKVDTKKAGSYEIKYFVSDSNKNKTEVKRLVTVNEKKEEKKVINDNKTPNISVKDGLTYVDGILIVNKKYALPEDYAPGVNNGALSALKQLQADASQLGYDLSLVSGYRSYETQKNLYNKYVSKDGEEKANTYSAKPGHSEHQTGLAFDIGSVSSSFADTDDAKWLANNAHLYGFIIRYPKGKTDITGYIYEPWHVRYLGVEIATKVKESGLTLEEYLHIN